jgi:hypothetical protein
MGIGFVARGNRRKEKKKGEIVTGREKEREERKRKKRKKIKEEREIF